VEIQPNRGARIRAIPVEEALERAELRVVLEGFVAARAAERVTPDEARELRKIAAQMRRAVRNVELQEYGDLNAELHRRISAISAHATAAAAIERLQWQVVRHQYVRILRGGRPAVSLGQHGAIVDAICRHDAAGAEAAMRTHVDSVADVFRAEVGAPLGE
jgi:DNA-binding GntR family transcriptional regulator